MTIDDDLSERQDQRYFNGCNKVVGLWYQKFKNPLYLLAFRHLNDTELAWDAVHDVFKKLVEYSTGERKIKLKVETDIFNCLKLRVRMRSIDIIRREKRKTTVNLDNLFHVETNDNLFTKLEISDELATAVKIARNNQLLKEEHLHILEWELGGMKNQEMADRLGIPKVKLAKEKWHLKRILQRVLIKIRYK